MAKPGVPNIGAPLSKPSAKVAVAQFEELSPGSKGSIRSILDFGAVFEPANGFPTPSSTVSSVFPATSLSFTRSFVFAKETAVVTKFASTNSRELAAGSFAMTKKPPAGIMVLAGKVSMVFSSPVDVSSVVIVNPARETSLAVGFMSSIHSSAVLRSLPAHITSLMTICAFAATGTSKPAMKAMDRSEACMVTIKDSFCASFEIDFGESEEEL